MEANMDAPSLDRKTRTVWVKYMLIALTVEKTIQHAVVTAAFWFNWAEIRSTVVVNPDILMFLGAIVGVLFAVSLWGVMAHRRWATNLIATLAVFDILGEFVAQGTIGIVVTVSLLVATILLILSLQYRHRQLGTT